MREIRPSGSVRGVESNLDPYRDRCAPGWCSRCRNQVGRLLGMTDIIAEARRFHLLRKTSDIRRGRRRYNCYHSRFLYLK